MWDRGSRVESIAEIRAVAEAVRGGKEAPENLARVLSGNVWRLQPTDLCDAAELVVFWLGLPRYNTEQSQPEKPAVSPEPVKTPLPIKPKDAGLFRAFEEEPW